MRRLFTSECVTDGVTGTELVCEYGAKQDDQHDGKSDHTGLAVLQTSQ